MLAGGDPLLAYGGSLWGFLCRVLYMASEGVFCDGYVGMGGLGGRGFYCSFSMGILYIRDSLKDLL